MPASAPGSAPVVERESVVWFIATILRAVDNRPMPKPPLIRPLLLALLLVACSPTLDWREVRPVGSELKALLPCKPERVIRTLTLAGAAVPFELLACQAGDVTWALGSADVGDPARVGTALAALRRARPLNLDGRETANAPALVRGSVPDPAALRFTVVGRRPDGIAVTEDSMVFAHGTRVFHAAALGSSPAPGAVQSFFDGLELPR